MPKSVCKTKSDQVFYQGTAEDEIAEFVDAIKQSPGERDSLVRLLPEQIPLYVNRSTNETIRLRGYIMAAFEQVGLPEAAFPYVLDELENGRDPYLVAAAAKALRGLDRPTNQVVPFLLKAIENVKGADDSLTFESYKPRWPLTTYTTALKEIFQTFGWLGAHARCALADLEALSEDRCHDFSATIRTEISNAIDLIRSDGRDVGADCCALPTSLSLKAICFRGARRAASFINDIELEDQDGHVLRYGDYFSRTPSIVVFFYSRCNNPNKCSLTVTKLARLQQAIMEAGLGKQLKTAAITYDPGYDLPPRLKTYGQNRGVLFDDHNRILRTRSGFKELRDYFRLGVNFINSIVNRHRIELFILDDRGRIAVTFARLQWDVQEVLDHAKELLRTSSNSHETLPTHYDRSCQTTLGQTMSTGMLSAVPPLVVAFFPKCPVCWAAYLSAFGIAGLQNVPYSPWLLPVFILLMLINLMLVFKRSKQRKGIEAFYLCLSGTFVVLVLGMHFQMQYSSYLGIAMILAGSLLSSLPDEISFQFKSFILRAQNYFGNLLKNRNPA